MNTFLYTVKHFLTISDVSQNKCFVKFLHLFVCLLCRKENNFCKKMGQSIKTGQNVVQLCIETG